MKNDEIGILNDYLESMPIKNPIAVTLTSRQWNDGQALDEICLERDITFFLNRLNYKLFRKGFSKHGKKLDVLPVIEGDRNTDFHCHLALELPENLGLNEMEQHIRECWGKTRFGRANGNFAIKIEPKIDDGWRKYKLKEKTKADGVIPSINWINFSSSVME